LDPSRRAGALHVPKTLLGAVYGLAKRKRAGCGGLVLD
jgi:hypothetical protein